MWTAPKPIVKTGFPYQPHKNGQKIANVYVCTSYKTGLPLYYIVTIGSFLHIHNFLTLEEAMIFCDIHNFWVDTTDWNDPDIGLTKFYSPSTKVTLEDGRTIEVGH